MKRVKKLIASALSLVLIFSLLGCEKKKAAETTSTPTPTTEAQNPGTVTEDPKPTKPVILTDDDAIYDAALAEYEGYLEKAHGEVKNVSLRYTLEAIAEAKLMESAVYIPGSSDGGTYA
ncbi:MAG: hypothetical protein J5648_07910, partial [Lachnospiraceae bacterium]|nr:hypothetical protein [Lachnospiraceae bacterium]